MNGIRERAIQERPISAPIREHPIQEQSIAPQKQLKSIFPKMQDKYTEYAWQAAHPYLTAMEKTGKDLLTVPAHFFNQMFLNLPRAATQAMGYEYPSQAESPVADIASKAAGVAGAVTSGPIKALLKAPGAIIKGTGLLSKVLRGTAGGALLGGAYTPTEAEIPVLAPKERLGQAMTGGVIGAAFPMASAAVSYPFKLLTRARASVSYIPDVVAPQTTEVIKANIQRFNSGIQNSAKKLGMTDKAINTVKSMGYNKVNQINQKYGGSTASISEKLENLFTQKADVAPQMKFDTALEGLKGKNFSGKGVYNVFRSFINKQGAISSNDPFIKELSNNMEILKSNNYKMNISDFKRLRDILSQNTSGDKSIQFLKNSLYNAVEKSGATGLKAARTLSREGFKMKENINKSLISEGKLNKINTLSAKEILKLRQLEKYLGYKFVDEARAIAAAKELEKLTSKIQPENILKDLMQARDAALFNSIKREYKDLLGEEQANKIFSEIKKHARITKLKGAGASIIKLGIGYAALHRLSNAIFGGNRR